MYPTIISPEKEKRKEIEIRKDPDRQLVGWATYCKEHLVRDFAASGVRRTCTLGRKRRWGLGSTSADPGLHSFPSEYILSISSRHSRSPPATSGERVFFFFFFFLPDPMDSMVFRVRKQSTQNIETSRMPTSNEYSRTACTMTEHYTILILTKINHFGKHKRYPKNTLHVSFINGGHGTT